MTVEQFKQEYEKLAKTYIEYKNPFKEDAIASVVIDLDFNWWKSMVTQLLISKYRNGKEINIDEAARGERMAKKNIELTENMLKLDSIIKQKEMTPKGLENALKKMGAGSLLETLYKKTK